MIIFFMGEKNCLYKITSPTNSVRNDVKQKKSFYGRRGIFFVQ